MLLIFCVLLLAAGMPGYRVIQRLEMRPGFRSPGIKWQRAKDKLSSFQVLMLLNSVTKTIFIIKIYA
jgi:hypothetical protein